jgi:hypothetical protein
MSKFLLNLLLQISKALVNSKFQFLIRKFIFPDFRPGRPRGPLGLWPSQPLAAPLPAGRKRPAGPSSPCVGRIFTGNTFSFSDHAFPSRPPPPSVTTTRAPPVGFIVSTAAPPRPCPAPRMPPSVYSPPSSLPLLIPFKPSVNGP